MRGIDRRRTVIPLAVALVAAGGWLLDGLAGGGPGAAEPAPEPPAHGLLDDAAARRAHQHFQQAVAMLQAGRHDHAVTALHEVLEIYPRLPEAHANMGYALLGLGQHEAAAGFFHSASDLRPTLHTAYYGLALAESGRGDVRAALAAMQAYAHLASADDPWLERGQAAMRQWEATLAAGEAASGQPESTR